MKSIIQREKYQREPNPKTKNFKPIDHVKYEGQVRSGHNICCLCSFLLELSSCPLLTKTAINHRFFSIKSEVSGWI